MKAVREDVQSPSTWRYCSICQRWFSSLNGPQVFPSLPCSQYTGFEACRMQTSFLFLHGIVQSASLHVIYEAWIPQTTHFFVILKEKSAHSYFSPWLWAWIETWELEILRTAEGMISSSIIIDNSELSWRRRKCWYFYKPNLGFYLLVERRTEEIHSQAPSVPICTCVLIRGDCSGHFESTCWVTAG